MLDALIVEIRILSQSMVMMESISKAAQRLITTQALREKLMETETICPNCGTEFVGDRCHACKMTVSELSRIYEEDARQDNITDEEFKCYVNAMENSFGH